MAAPNSHTSDRGNKVVKKIVVQKNAPKKIIVQKAAPKKVVKHVVVKQAPRKVVKHVAVKKAAPKKVAVKQVSHKAKTYRVRSGDTLSTIAARTHVSVNQLIKINKLWGNKANQLWVGMTIRLA